MVLLTAEATADDDIGPYAVIGVLAIDTGFTVYNLATLGEPKSGVYGFGEAMLTVPQTLVFGGIAVFLEGHGGDDDAWIPASLALWTAALAAHGIYTVASDDDGDDVAARPMLLSFGGKF